MKRHISVHHFVGLGLLLILCSGCGTSGPARDELYSTQMDRGGQAFRKGRTLAAQKHFEQAFQRALAMDAPCDAADAGYNAALCSARADQYQQAGLFLDTSINIRRMAGLNVPWDMLLLQAKLLSRGQDKRAEAVARQALADADSLEAENACKLFIIQLQLAEARADDADKMLNTIGSNTLDAGQKGEYAALNGSVLRMKGSPAEAARSFSHAADLQRSAGLYAEMTDSMQNAAACYEKAGMMEPAASCYLQCASTAYGQKRMLVALNAIKKAMAILENTGNTGLVEQSKNLLKLIEEQVDEKKTANESP